MAKKSREEKIDAALHVANNMVNYINITDPLDKKSPAEAEFKLYRSQIERAFPKRTSSFYAEQIIAIKKSLKLILKKKILLEEKNKKTVSLSIEEIEFLEKTLTGCDRVVSIFTSGGIAALEMLSAIDRAKHRYDNKKVLVGYDDENGHKELTEKMTKKDTREILEMLGLRVRKPGQQYPQEEMMLYYLLSVYTGDATPQEALEMICSKYEINSKAATAQHLKRAKKELRKHMPNFDFPIPTQK